MKEKTDEAKYPKKRKATQSCSPRINYSTKWRHKQEERKKAFMKQAIEQGKGRKKKIRLLQDAVLTLLTLFDTSDLPLQCLKFGVNSELMFISEINIF